jgi:hypothetical protein
MVVSCYLRRGVLSVLLVCRPSHFLRQCEDDCTI